MGCLLKLVWRDFRYHRSVLAFTLTAIIAASCLSVWFVASIDMNVLSGDNGKKDCYGVYTLALAADEGLPDAVLDGVLAMQGVSRAAPACQMTGTMLLEGFQGALVPSGMGERRSPMLLGMGDGQAPFEIEDGRWFTAKGECVVGTAASDILTAVAGQEDSGREVVPGDRIRVTTPRCALDLTVVGTFEQHIRPSITRQHGGQTFAFGFGVGLGGGRPGGGMTGGRRGVGGAEARRGGGRRGGRQSAISAEAPSVYVSMETARALSRGGFQPNILFVQLESADDVDGFRGRVESLLGVPLGEAGIRLTDTRPPENASSGAEAMRGVIGQAWSTVGIVILASVFIIFTTLSMSVSEKTRYLAMLRTIGFTRGQVALLILLEGFFLGVLGWLGGIASGWLLLTVMLAVQTGSVPLVTLSWQALAFAFVCSTAGSLAASLIPAWRATRVSAADVMPVRIRCLSRRRLLVTGVVGLVLLALIPLMTFGLPLPAMTRLTLFSTAGTAFLGVGMIFIVPWASVFTERVLGAAVARVLGFSHRFFSQVLTGNQWQTVTTTLAVSIGLGLFTAIYIWSFSMLTMFSVPETVPDVLVRFQEGAIGDDTTRSLSSMRGILPGRFMRVSVAQPNVDAALTRVLSSKGVSAANLVAMGVDAETAWRRQDPMVRLRFVSGTREEVRRAFAVPGARVCVIPETLAVNGKLALGDEVRFLAPCDGRRPRPVASAAGQGASEAGTDGFREVGYKVVGIVDFAWVWMSKCAGVRVSAGRTSGLVFTPYEALLEDFGAPDQEFFWFDKADGVTHAEIERRVREIASEGVRRAREGHPRRRLADSYAGGTLWDSGINRNHCMVSTNESLNNSLNFRAFSVIDTMAQMPLVILLLSSIAIVNTMVVSVKSRRWEFGVLRACGVTRGALVRIVFGEALLIGLCACVVSFAFGFYYSWLATRLMDLAPMFGIIAPPMTIPWGRLLPGYALAVGLAMAAGVYPALSAGISDVSALLQRRG